MSNVPYPPDLAWVHHAGHGSVAEDGAPGIIALLRAAGLGDGARVLEVGCGSGRLARRLDESGVEVLGVDASPAMIALARVFRRAGDSWRRTDEQHRNVTVELERAIEVLRAHGVDAQERQSFGQERPLDGLAWWAAEAFDRATTCCAASQVFRVRGPRRDVVRGPGWNIPFGGVTWCD